MHRMPPLHIWLHFERSTLRWSFNTQSSSDLGIKKWRMLSRFILTNTDYPLERTWGGSILITEKTSQTPSQELVKVFYALSETNNDQFMTKSKFQLRQKWSEVPLCKDKCPRHQAVSTFHGSLGWSHSWTWGKAELSRWWKFKKLSKIPNSKYWTWSSCCELRGQSSGHLSGVDLPLTHRTHKPLDLWRQFALISESHQNQGDNRIKYDISPRWSADVSLLLLQAFIAFSTLKTMQYLMNLCFQKGEAAKEVTIIDILLRYWKYQIHW